MIVQSGRYSEILQQGSDFAALVAAHDSSMALVETAVLGPEKRKHVEAESSSKSSIVEVVESHAGSSTVEAESNSQTTLGPLVNDEERASGHVSLRIYKEYMTEVWGWWSPLLVLVLSVLWQGMVLACDYWLAYGISVEQAVRPSLLIQVYATITAISVVIMLALSFFIAFVGLQTANSFFKQILSSILHAPMSFLDATPSGRVLSRVRPSVCCLLHYAFASSLHSECQFLMFLRHPRTRRLSIFFFLSTYGCAHQPTRW